MEQILFVVFITVFITTVMKLLDIRLAIQSAQDIEEIDSLYKSWKLLWLRPSLFKDLQLKALHRIVEKDSAEIEHMRTLAQKLEVFFKYKNSKAVNQNKELHSEKIVLISKAVLAGIMDSMAKENFAETVELYNRIERSGKVYPPTKEMYNKIQNFFELTHNDLISQNMYTEFKLRYRN